MKIVVLHGWLRGNLGDYSLARIIIGFLRARYPNATIVMASEPRDTWNIPEDFLQCIDHYVERSFRIDPSDLLEQASVVIQMAGGGMQDLNDKRGGWMLRDADLCHEKGVKHILAGHSFHPSFDLERLKHSLVLAREPMSYQLMVSRGIPAILTADPAFLEPVQVYTELPRKHTALFLRRKHIKEISIESSVITLDDRRIEYTAVPLVLASSDPVRDDDVLLPIAEKYDLRYERCLDMPHLLSIIGSSQHVISDRYHPIIFAAMLGVPWTFMKRHGSVRDEGLEKHLRERSLSELSALATSGLESMAKFIEDERQDKITALFP